MSDQNVPAPYILLKQQMGERKPDQEGEKPFQTYFFRGEILLEIPQKEQIPREDGTRAHNYCKYDDPDVTTYNNGTNVSPLYGAELDYLLGIDRPSDRAIEYVQASKLAWIMDLRSGTEVFFKLNKERDVPLIIPGIIRYYGCIPGHDGVMFGIEIKVITRCLCNNWAVLKRGTECKMEQKRNDILARGTLYWHDIRHQVTTHHCLKERR